MVINRRIFQPGFLDRFGIVTGVSAPPSFPDGPFDEGFIGRELGDYTLAVAEAVTIGADVTYPVLVQLTDIYSVIFYSTGGTFRHVGITDTKKTKMVPLAARPIISFARDFVSAVRIDNTRALINHIGSGIFSQVRIINDAGLPSSLAGSQRTIEASWVSNLHMDILGPDLAIFVGKTAANVVQFRVVSALGGGSLTLGSLVTIETNDSGRGTVRAISPTEAVYAHQQADGSSSAWVLSGLNDTTSGVLGAELDITGAVGAFTASAVGIAKAGTNKAVVVAHGDDASPAVGRVIQDISGSPSFLNTFNASTGNGKTYEVDSIVSPNSGSTAVIVEKGSLQKVVINDIQGSPVIDLEEAIASNKVTDTQAIFDAGITLTSGFYGIIGLDASDFSNIGRVV